MMIKFKECNIVIVSGGVMPRSRVSHAPLTASLVLAMLTTQFLSRPVLVTLSRPNTHRGRFTFWQSQYSIIEIRVLR